MHLRPVGHIPLDAVLTNRPLTESHAVQLVVLIVLIVLIGTAGKD